MVLSEDYVSALFSIETLSARSTHSWKSFQNSTTCRTNLR